MKEFIKNHENKLILVLGFILVAGLSFEAGLVRGKGNPESPIVIEKPSPSSKIEPQAANPAPASADTPFVQSSQNLSSVPAQPETKNCAFVGSKNSNKYHLPTCQYAKRIKPENIVCFSSVEDAVSKNYLPDKGCIK
ncbi:MAG: hypothetical protein NTZ97_00175 [Candidatus Moranbacteria bacterium]|nr:hypothetical protein [Candidatus Moranbacteria bacterium]